MDEFGQVLKAKDGIATVRMNRTDACAQCGLCGIAAFKEDHDIIVEAENRVGAYPGDWVRVETRSRQFLSAIAIVFLLPLAASALGYMLGASVASLLGVARTVAGLLGVVLAFALSYRGVRAYDRRAQTKGSLQPVIVEVCDNPPTGGTSGR